MTVVASSWAKRVLAILFVLCLYYLIQWLTLVLAVYPHLGLPDHLTEWGSWVVSLDHHAWQMFLALGMIFILAGRRWRRWGLNFYNSEESFRILKTFCLYYGVYFVGIGFLLQLLFFPPPLLDHPFTMTHVAGRLLFGFLFVGLSEEILFRGLIHSYLIHHWPEVWNWRSWEMPVAGIITTLIFTIAHINFTLFPFEITRLQPLQLLQAFVLGLYYSWVYHRTRSLLNPILAHNFSNGTLWLSEYMLVWLKA